MIKNMLSVAVVFVCVGIAALRLFNEPLYHHFFFVIKNGDFLFDDKQFRLNTKIVSIEDRFDSLYFLKLKKLSIDEMDLGLMQLNSKLSFILSKLPRNTAMQVGSRCTAFTLNSDFFKNYRFVVINEFNKYAFFTKKQINEKTIIELCTQAIVPKE